MNCAKQCIAFSPRRRTDRVIASSEKQLSPQLPRLLYASDQVLAFDKPAGLLSVPGRGPDKEDCLHSRVKSHFPDALVVHRLDMATSGVMLFARLADSQRQLSAAFASRQVHKRYIAIAHGSPEALSDKSSEWFEIDLPIALDWPNRPLRVIDARLGKPSLTRMRLLGFDAENNVSRLELEPITGRSHQLRVHLSAIGHPILGDQLYADAETARKSDRLLLHAQRIVFKDPATDKWVEVESQLPF